MDLTFISNYFVKKMILRMNKMKISFSNLKMNHNKTIFLKFKKYLKNIARTKARKLIIFQHFS